MKKEVKEYFFEYKMGFMLTVATIITIVAIILSMVLLNVFYDTGNYLKFLFDDSMKFSETMFWYFIIIVGIFLWSVLHEIIHGIFYQIGGATRKNITYGAALEKGIFYCRCGEYVNKKTIMMSLMAPFTIIGVITLIISLFFNWPWLAFLSAVNIGGAGADLCMFFFFLKRANDIEFREYGDSSFFSLKTSEKLDEKKFICVKPIDKEKVPANDNTKRLVISKASWKWLLIILAILVLNIIIILLFE